MLEQSMNEDMAALVVAPTPGLSHVDCAPQTEPEDANSYDSKANGGTNVEFHYPAK